MDRGGTENGEGDRRGPGLPRHPLLRVFVALVTLNAVLAIWALLAGDFGPTQGRILITSLFVTAAMIGLLVNVVPARRGVLWPVPPVSAALVVAAFALYIAFVWMDRAPEFWIKMASSALTVGVAGSLVGLLGLVPLRPGHHWLRFADDVVVGLLAATLLFLLWSPRGDSEVLGRIMGVEAVLVAALTLVIPVVSHYLPPAGASRGRDTGGADTWVRYCPRCGATLDPPAEPGSTARCPSCGLRFTVLVN